MLGSNVLDVIIGRVLVYLLLSLVTSSVREALAGMWKTRARYLKKGIAELLGGPDQRSPELVEAFYQHPRIFALYSLRILKQIVQGSIKLTFPKFHPAQTIEVGSVVGFALQRASDHRFSFVQIHVVIRPHVTQVIRGLG